MEKPDLIHRGQQYAQPRGLTITHELGAGVHGIVFSAQSQSKNGRVALKVFAREIDYRRERDVYLRLNEYDITLIRGCNVPEMLAYDDTAHVIEMTIVARPFVLDFAGAYLDTRPDFSEEVMADWEAEKREQFETRWPEVQAILRALEGHGVFMVDVNPGNIS